jgi:hypothetical protein
MDRGEVMGRQHLDRYRHLLETLDQKGVGRAILLAATLIGSNGPAGAITAEVAKKCRELAIQAHPPQPAGTIPSCLLEVCHWNMKSCASL